MTKARTATIRQEIEQLLSNEPCTAREISQSVRISEKEVYGHLEKVEKSLKNKHKKMLVEPYQCLGCGFEFSKRKKYSKPGKCPGCKQGRIVPAVFSIKKHQ